jgi:DNA-binding HxlR family transcriptional regulator
MPKGTKKTAPAGCPETPIPCATGGLLAILTRPWTMHILWVLGHDGPTRFGMLRRKTTGISSRVLAERLRMLEARGFVYRKYEATIPPAVTYGLTNRMDEMRPILEQLDRLAGIWYQEDLLAGRVPKEVKAAQEVA